jgi:hypothetical protein
MKRHIHIAEIGHKNVVKHFGFVLANTVAYLFQKKTK